MIKKLYIIGLDIKEGRANWVSNLLHSVMRYVDRNVGLLAGPLFSQYDHLYGRQRPMAVVLVQTEEGMEIHTLFSEKLSLDPSGNPTRGLWTMILRKEYGQRDAPSFRFEYILDELTEIYKVRKRAQADGAFIEEIDQAQAIVILENAKRYGRRPVRRAA